jgi:hypothetical protein
VNAAPAHLEAKLRFWDFTIGQIAAAVIGVLGGFAWASYLSPFGGLAGAISGAYIAGVPVAAAFVASQTEFDLWGLLAAIARWRRLEGRYVPGPGGNAHGYVLTGESDDCRRAGDDLPLDLDALWEDECVR